MAYCLRNLGKSCILAFLLMTLFSIVNAEEKAERKTRSATPVPPTPPVQHPKGNGTLTPNGTATLSNTTTPAAEHGNVYCNSNISVSVPYCNVSEILQACPKPMPVCNVSEILQACPKPEPVCNVSEILHAYPKPGPVCNVSEILQYCPKPPPKEEASCVDSNWKTGLAVGFICTVAYGIVITVVGLKFFELKQSRGNMPIEMNR